MFFTLILENKTGQQIDLSKTANRFMFSKIEGLNPPAGTISTSRYAGMNCIRWSSPHDISKYITPRKIYLCMPRVSW